MFILVHIFDLNGFMETSYEGNDRNKLNLSFEAQTISEVTFNAILII